jgi:hypothetical protein
MDFNPNANNAVASIAVQCDGKILLGGAFTQFTQGSLLITRNHLALLQNNGGVDRAFNPDVNGLVHSLALQPDGKILLGGDFSTINSIESRSNLARLSSSSAALQFLTTAADGKSVTWLRSGTGPELQRVTLELSSDLNTWTSLAQGSRIQDGWQFTGIMLPEEEICYIRIRGYYPSGTFNGSGSIAESVWQVYLKREQSKAMPWIPLLLLDD